MKILVKRLFDRTVLAAVNYLKIHSTPPYTVVNELQRRAVLEAADYAQKNMALAVHFINAPLLRSFAIKKVMIDGIVAEFGVFSGNSINQIAREISIFKNNKIQVYGFDSFEGLMEDWVGTDSPKGTFDMGGNMPPVDSNVKLIKGWFHESIPLFLTKFDASTPFSFIHIDGDTFAAAKTVFDKIGDRIVPGTVVVFDEYFGYRGWRLGEHKAWSEFVESKRLSYEYLGFSNQQVAVRVI
ncbi:MAG: class I SAM-dependent methyltransferase [Pseudomonadota bacterium]